MFEPVRVDCSGYSLEVPRRNVLMLLKYKMIVLLRAEYVLQTSHNAPNINYRICVNRIFFTVFVMTFEQVLPVCQNTDG